MQQDICDRKIITKYWRFSTLIQRVYIDL